MKPVFLCCMPLVPNCIIPYKWPQTAVLRGVLLGSAFLLVAVGVLSFIQLLISTHPLTPWTHRECNDPWRLIQTGLQVASEVQKLWERLTGQVIVTLFLRSSFLILFPQIFLNGTCYVLNQTGKQLFYESAWKSLLHRETAAFDCFSVAGDGIWLSSLTASISWFFGVTLLECTCTHRAEVAKHFFLEDHPVLKMSGSSKVTDVLYSPSMFRYVREIWILAIQCP